MAQSKLDLLEKRLENLETSVFGEANKDAHYPKETEQVVDTLANIHNHVQSTASGRPKLEASMKRLVELEKYLDPAYVERLTLSTDAKAEIILSEEDLIRKQATNLEQVKNMCDVLGSEHIKVVPSLEGKLQELSQVHLQQQDEASDLSEEVKDWLLKYNNIITLLSKQFVQWDEIVTKLEIEAQPKKVLD